ncbi:MAG: IS30 family transposase [Cyanobacteria bacterium J06636_27]
MAQLTLEQRYEIAALLKTGSSLTKIASQIGKHKSTISREIRRNADGRSGAYRAELAQRKTQRRHKEKQKKITLCAEIEARILDYLTQEYSPEQIKGRCKREGKAMVSTERIYQYIWEDKKRGGILYTYLRNKGKKYAKRGQTKGSRGQIPNRISIEQRPEVVELKERFGDLEIDLVIGKGHQQALLTINDRATGLLFMDKVPNKKAEEIEAKTIELLQDWKPLIWTITSDNGKEFARHQTISEQLNIDFFFAQPYHSWQRGANENLNGLVRQYFPKNMDFKSINQAQIKQVVNTLNNRPRKRFDFLSPNEMVKLKIDQHKDVAFIT